MSEPSFSDQEKSGRKNSTTSSDSERTATSREEEDHRPRTKSTSTTTSSTSTEEDRKDGVRSIFSLTSSDQRSKLGDKHRLHTGQKKSHLKHSVPLINDLQGGALPKTTASPRTSMLVKDIHGAFGAGHNSDNTRLFISPRVMGDRGKLPSTEPAMSPRKILNLKNHIVEIPMKQPLKLMEQDAVSQFLSPRLENSPRVFEARMIDLQMQYERHNASLTKSMYFLTDFSPFFNSCF